VHNQLQLPGDHRLTDNLFHWNEFAGEKNTINKWENQLQNVCADNYRYLQLAGRVICSARKHSVETFLWFFSTKV
jgi:hypothetical protein